MFTVCPKCALTLVVTAADLRVAQGYVRCGRCSSVFNALARLTDERQPPAPAEEAAPPPADSAAPPPATAENPLPEEPIPEHALEFNPETTDVAAVFVEPPPDPEWTAATGSFRAMIAANQEPGQEEPPASPADVEIVSGFVAATHESESATAAPVPASRPPPTAATSQPPQAQQPAPGADITVPALPTQPAGEAEALAPDADAESAPPRWRSYAWGAAAGLAALALLAQVAHHYRDTLATTRLNRPLTALYAALGSPLVPHWDLHAYDVRQLGASADAAGAGLITVRASVRNAAQHAQPLPLLRVTLQDRFGNRIASGDVPPRYYVPHTVPASALLSGGQRIDAEMDFVDPGASAVGFEIDACLPARGGAVSCANDSTAR